MRDFSGASCVVELVGASRGRCSCLWRATDVSAARDLAAIGYIMFLWVSYDKWLIIVGSLWTILYAYQLRNRNLTGHGLKGTPKFQFWSHAILILLARIIVGARYFSTLNRPTVTSASFVSYKIIDVFENSKNFLHFHMIVLTASTVNIDNCKHQKP